ncbi:DNA-binding transcriptional regulator, LysR family [Bacillus sp. OV166]|uniref:LysR family transcriptional regulator n=1 Tax=Bacillus sp. OV166 TaxID=1882763 RepID=UPI000A2AD18E|nr:LysR family transcriptional regulator [Bacillus sp. OV166]SMQ87070.1 DNA-binding transcriptional regulator, LysR family [Bacillus sp. OV166]
MELRHLKTFKFAAEYLNFTKAAQKLNFTQPAVTVQIQTLEQELNQELFIRIGKKNFLTPAGEILKTYTDQLFSIVEEIESSFTELSNSYGNVTIAAGESYCANYFPYVISEYLKLYPHVQIKLISCKRDEIIKGIESNKYDIGIISGELSKNGMTNIVIAEEDMVLVVSKDLYARYPEDQLLTKFPLIKYQADGYYETMMSKYLRQSKLSSQNVIEIGSLEGIKKAVLNNIGVGLGISVCIKKEISNGDLVPILVTENKVKVKTSIITLKEKENVVTIQSFINVIQKIWNSISTME